MEDSLQFTLYRAKAVLHDFCDACFVADMEDPALRMRRLEEIIESLDACGEAVSQIEGELKRIHAGVNSGAALRRYEEAVSLSWAATSAEGWHRTAEYYRRLMFLRDF